MAGNAAKFTVDEKFIRTKRAADMMRVAQSMRQPVYIWGSTGFGKTSFVFDFLNRRRFHYFTAEEQDLSELSEWYQKHQDKEEIIVVDDLDNVVLPDVREEYYALFESMLSNRNVWLIMISRCSIPTWLKPLYIQKIFTIISEQELSFSEQEYQDYLAKWELDILPETEKTIYSQSLGYPLVCRIAALRIKLLDSAKIEGNERARVELNAVDEARKDLWDYLDSYVFDQWDVNLQEFFTDLSIVNQFDLQLAQIITKRNDAAALIELAKETGNFLEEHIEDDKTIYKLRMPVIYTMRRRLEKRYSASYIEKLYYNAGSCYEYQDKIVEALQMYEKCRNNEGISRILVRNSRKHAGSGHYWELRNYYKALPEDVIKQDAELICAMSMLESIMLNDEASDYWYQVLENHAKTLTGSAKKLAQARLMHLDIILPHKGTLKIADIVKNAGNLIVNKEYIFPEMSLTNNQPSIMQGSKDFCEWSKKDRFLAKSIGKILEIMLRKSGKGVIDIALAESFMEKGEDRYEIMTLANRAKVQTENVGNYELAFVAVAILAQLTAQYGQMDDSLESLRSFRESVPNNMPRLKAGVDTMYIRLLLYLGSNNKIMEWLEQAPDEDKEFCTLERFHYITKARVYLMLGKKEKALLLLQQLQYFAERRERIYLKIESGVLLAITQYRLGDDKYKETLQTAITLAEEFHFVRVLSREGAALWEILKSEQFEWKDKGYKKQVFDECSSIADVYPAYLSEKQSGTVTLSNMEIKVLRMQAEGLSVEKIAEALSLSKAGVKYYNQQTYKKLGVNSKAQAITEARNLKLI